MIFQIIFSLFVVFKISENVSWNPCPSLRSTFEDIIIDDLGRKSVNCVCKNKLFGNECQYKGEKYKDLFINILILTIIFDCLLSACLFSIFY